MNNNKILIVEDDAAIREIMQILLEGEGHVVLLAKHGKHAFEVMATEGIPAMVFLDMQMPVMNGHEFLRLFRENLATREVPVVVISANADFSDVVGTDKFIKKPANLDVVISYAKEFTAK